MQQNDLDSKLKSMPFIRDACDLDVLLFFYRHPTSLLTSEQLVAAIGYKPVLIAASLDGLVEAGLLRRSLNPSQVARLYVLEMGRLSDDQLLTLLKIAATRTEREQLMRLLRAAPDGAPAADLQDSVPTGKTD